MTFDTPSLVRLGQAIGACYDPSFMGAPETVKVSGNPVTILYGTDPDGVKPYGAIYRDDTLSATVCAIRGTEGFWEWVKDAEAFLAPFKPLPGAWAHNGFRTLHGTLTAGTEPILRFLWGLPRPVVITGHSLGAALATLVAAELGGCDLVTFAGPRVFDDDGAAMALSRLSSNTRIVNAQDLVPTVPKRILPLFPYAHVGAAMEVSSFGIVKDEPQAWHALSTYLHLLDPAQPLDSDLAVTPTKN